MNTATALPESYPITVAQIYLLLTTTKNERFARYLLQVMQLADTKTKQLNQTIEDVEFRIEASGMLLPFGEVYSATDHPYNSDPVSCMG